jgi:FkbM family methyltransferase
VIDIVVDLGCRGYGEEESIRKLIERFNPTDLVGFDPLLQERYILDHYRGTKINLAQSAAWTEEGHLELATGSFREWDATVMVAKNGRGEWTQTRKVRCFDLAEYLSLLPGRIVLKMDVEGAEFPLLEHLIKQGVDERLELLLVEWHDEKMGSEFTTQRASLLERLRCPVEEW